MNQIQKIITRLFESRAATHITFCTSVFLFFFIMVQSTAQPSKLAFNAVTIGLFDLLCIYLGRWCARKLLADNQFLPFFLQISVIAIAMTFLAVAGNLYLKIGPPKSLSLYLTFNFPITLSLIVLGVFLTFTRTTILQRINAAETAQRQKESELNLLLSQLRPHFLFNTLNNLYGLSLSEHEKLPNLLLKLSNLLRYSLYETSQPYVLLKDELNYIMCYIEFEQIRLGKKMRITENISLIDAEQLRIPPMILITFVENAVKHSKKTIHNDIVIDIFAEMVDEYLHFSISNSIGNNLFPNERSSSSGIGLSATIKRLDGLFGKDYRLEQYTADNYYHVKLKLKTA